MNRTGTTIVAAALALGMLGLAPPAVAATDCADPAHPVRGYDHLDAAVGTRRVTTVELGVHALSGCGITTAVAIVSSPRHTYRVTLHRQAGEDGAEFERWTGDLELDPRTLRNTDAGTWPVRYEVGGENPESVVDPFGQVVRATRASFDAGPEPVREDTISFRGQLERADWNTRRYSGISRTITIIKVEEAGGYTAAATLTTRHNGRYRTTQPFLGPGDYQMFYAGDENSGLVYSRVDHVDPA